MSKFFIPHSGEATGRNSYGDCCSSGDDISTVAATNTISTAYCDRSCDAITFPAGYQNRVANFDFNSYCACLDACSFSVRKCFSSSISFLLYVVYALDMV